MTFGPRLLLTRSIHLGSVTPFIGVGMNGGYLKMPHLCLLKADA
jgi:hypothetical protein